MLKKKGPKIEPRRVPYTFFLSCTNVKKGNISLRSNGEIPPQCNFAINNKRSKLLRALERPAKTPPSLL